MSEVIEIEPAEAEEPLATDPECERAGRSGTLKRFRDAPLVVGVLLVLLTISLASVRTKNSTFDEGAHIPAGYTYVATGDLRLNPEHPPLVKILSGLPNLFLHPRIDTEDPSWKSASEWSFGSRFLFDGNDADRLVFWARVPVVLLSALLGLCIFLCARDLYGRMAGYVALVLYVFNPDLLAHGQLVTSDLAVTCFLFIAVYAFYRTLRSATLMNVITFCVAAGLAVVSKFSGILVFPMVMLVGVAFALSRLPASALPWKKSSPVRVIASTKGKLLLAGRLVVLSAVVAFAIIWACYGFRYHLSSDPEVSNRIDWQHYWSKGDAAASVMRIPQSLHLLPEGYTYGFLFVMDWSHQRLAYLAGDYSMAGWWYYFPVTFLVKTPIPLIILSVVGFFLMKRYGAGTPAELMLLLPMGLYWLVSLTSHVNIGNRHLLPIYPFLIVFASKAGRLLDRSSWPRTAAVCALLIWNVIGTLLIFPHFLAYFNELAGGPSTGYRLLTDSNIDWGQDLKGLAEYQRLHPDDEFYLSYFGTASPDYYGIRAHFLPGHNMQMARKLESKEVVPFDQIPSGSIVAISATNLSGVSLSAYRLPGTEEFLERLRNMQPIANIGYSILIYRIP